MKICGVIAEYNPFHDGHAFQLAETRKILGPDTAIVCIMSGNFVQRGEFAVLDKYRRARAAVQCGADLVLETPLGAVLSSAEGFARGAIRALDTLGAVQYLSFGSECGSARALLRAAEALDSPRACRAFRAALQEGLPYAAARQQSLREIDAAASALLGTPNNILGVEYCRALRETDSAMTPLSVCRRGAAHDSADVVGESVSASLLRSYLRRGAAEDCRPYMPAAAYEVLTCALASGAAPVLQTQLDAALLSYLRRLTAEDFARYERPEEGLTNRLAQSAWNAPTFEAACARAQTRRYPLSRIRRAYLRAFLDVPLSTCAQPPAYLRVLAIGAQGRTLLRLFSQSSAAVLITKPLHEKDLPRELQPALWRDTLSDELYALAMPDARQRVGGSHFRQTPYCAAPR